MHAVVRLLVIVAVALLADASALRATQSAPQAVAADAEAGKMFREVMSPFCPGLTLADCPSPNAFTLRDEIEARLKKGESYDAILDELVGRYGAQILSDPSYTPIGAVVWGVPFVLSALAAMGLALFLRRATHTRQPEPAATVEPVQLRNRLDEELAALD